jgi:transposase
MMPSKNLHSIKDFKVHYLPNQEFVMGLHLASTAKNDKVPTRVFVSTQAAVDAYKRGEIGASDKVIVKDVK